MARQVYGHKPPRRTPLTCIAIGRQLEPSNNARPPDRLPILNQVANEEDSMSDPLNRRNFMEASGRIAAGGAGLATWSALHPAIRTARGAAVSAGETIGVALIGCGDMGNANLDDFMRAPEVAIVGLCDVDQGHLERTAEKVEKKYGKKPASSVDFHAMLERKDVDAVIIGTPDHWHAIPFVYACMAGKDVNCEKPISHNIKEGRAMINRARRYKRVSQIRTQQGPAQHF